MSEVDAPFTSLQVNPWNNAAIPERVLLRGDRHLSPTAASYGHPEVFTIEHEHYLVFHAKMDDITRRTIFFKELSFDSESGEILELHEISTNPRQDISSFIVPVCRGRCYAADVDANGAVDTNDIFAFLNLWFASDPSSDWDGNGVIEVPDIFAFLTDHFACSGS